MVRIQFYQYWMLNRVFEADDILVQTIFHRLGLLLPVQYALQVTIEKDTLCQEIINGSSHMYEKLIEVLEHQPRFEDDTPAYPGLADRLKV